MQAWFTLGKIVSMHGSGILQIPDDCIQLSCKLSKNVEVLLFYISGFLLYFPPSLYAKGLCKVRCWRRVVLVDSSAAAIEGKGGEAPAKVRCSV